MSKKKIKKLLLLDDRNPAECSVGIEEIQSHTEYKAFIKLKDSESRKFIGFGRLPISEINEHGQIVVRDDEGFLGHANVKYAFKLEKNEAVPNKLKQLVIEFQKRMNFLIDQDNSDTEFNFILYTTSEDNHKKLVEYISD